MTSAIVPRENGGGSIGTSAKAWGGGWFAGRVTSRSQTLSLKYFCSDAPTRYNMSGMPSGTRPEDGDMVFQYLPPELFLIVDQNNLGNISGYYAIASMADLAAKLDTISGNGSGLTMSYGDIVLMPSGDGLTFYSDSAGAPILTINSSGFSFSGNVATGIPSGRILFLSDDNILTVSDTNITDITTLQNEVDVLMTGAFPTPGGTNLSIQYNDAGLFGGDINFKFNKTGAFGYSPYALRGALDIYRPLSFPLVGFAFVTGVAGSTYTNATVGYNVYPYVTVTGTKYYSPVALTGSRTVSGTHNISVSWLAQSGVSGYRVVGSGASSGVSYDTTGLSFVDNGASNASGELMPTYWGANMYLDYLSNLALSGQMYINGYRVITTHDILTAASSGGSGGIVFYDDTYVVKTTGIQTISGQKTFYDETVNLLSGDLESAEALELLKRHE